MVHQIFFARLCRQDQSLDWAKGSYSRYGEHINCAMVTTQNTTLSFKPKCGLRETTASKSNTNVCNIRRPTTTHMFEIWDWSKRCMDGIAKFNPTGNWKWNTMPLTLQI